MSVGAGLWDLIGYLTAFVLAFHVNGDVRRGWPSAVRTALCLDAFLGLSRRLWLAPLATLLLIAADARLSRRDA